jgi:hypothetical protein
VIVRADLPRGVQSAQIVHAAGESSPGQLPSGTYAVTLTAPSEQALQKEAERLLARGFVRREALSEPARPLGFWARCKLVFRDAVRSFASCIWPTAEVEPLAFVPIYEPDAPYGGALMALGIVPARREALRRHFSSLPTLK